MRNELAQQLPTKQELAEALTATMDLDEFHIEPIARRIFQRANTEAPDAPTFEGIALLAAFVSNALEQLRTMQERLERVQATYPDLVALARGKSVEDILPLYDAHGRSFHEQRVDRLELGDG